MKMTSLFIAFLLTFGVVEVSAAQAVAAPPSAQKSPTAQTPPAAGQPPAQTPPAVPPAAAAPVSSDYRVGPQDTLNITVFGEPQLSGKVRVDNDGSFPFQYLG